MRVDSFAKGQRSRAEKMAAKLTPDPRRRRQLVRMISSIQSNDFGHYSLILNALLVSIRVTREGLERRRFIERWKKYADQMKTVEALVERVADESWYDKHVYKVAEKKLERKYGRHKRVFVDLPEAEKRPGIGRMMVPHWGGKAESALPAKARKEIRSTLRNAFVSMEKARRRDFKKALRLIQEQIWGWWD